MISWHKSTQNSNCSIHGLLCDVLLFNQFVVLYFFAFQSTFSYHIDVVELVGWARNPIWCIPQFRNIICSFHRKNSL